MWPDSVVCSGVRPLQVFGLTMAAISAVRSAMASLDRRPERTPASSSTPGRANPRTGGRMGLRWTLRRRTCPSGFRDPSSSSIPSGKPPTVTPEQGRSMSTQSVARRRTSITSCRGDTQASLRSRIAVVWLVASSQGSRRVLQALTIQKRRSQSWATWDPTCPQCPPARFGQRVGLRRSDGL
eukprot:COSAG02_NODE_1297_length_13389_cov_6.460572_8_plen_182_part_00